jgi:hypothetical protein
MLIKNRCTVHKVYVHLHKSFFKSNDRNQSIRKMTTVQFYKICLDVKMVSFPAMSVLHQLPATMESQLYPSGAQSWQLPTDQRPQRPLFPHPSLQWWVFFCVMWHYKCIRWRAQSKIAVHWVCTSEALYEIFFCWELVRMKVNFLKFHWMTVI